MGEYFDQIPARVQSHVKGITKSAGLPDTDDALEKIAQAWLEKEKKFSEETGDAKIEEASGLGKDDAKGGIAMTYSGSLVAIGPVIDGVRKVGYASIASRQDVPDLISNDNSVLASDVAPDKPIKFKEGPVKSTSPIYKVAVNKENLSAEKEEEKIMETTMVLTDDFVELNKTMVM